MAGLLGVGGQTEGTQTPVSLLAAARSACLRDADRSLRLRTAAVDWTFLLLDLLPLLAFVVVDSLSDLRKALVAAVLVAGPRAQLWAALMPRTSPCSISPWRGSAAGATAQ
jgi:hypothetical protein